MRKRSAGRSGSRWRRAGARAGQRADGQQRRPRCDLPENPQLFGTPMPSVVKATAIINGEIITQTDIDQRLALLAIANGRPIPADEIERLRQQVLRNLIDETLQIQAAKAEEIEIKPSRHRQDGRARRRQCQADARADGRLSEGQRLLDPLDPPPDRGRNRLAPAAARRRSRAAISVGDEEVKAVIDKMNASKGTEEFRVGEIFLSANSANEAQALGQRQQDPRAAAAGRLVRRLCPPIFRSVDRRGRRRPRLGPPRAAARRSSPTRCARCGRARFQQPITVPGGYSIIAVQDTRKILTADPRDAVLSLKQVSVSFPKGTTRQQAEPIVARFAAGRAEHRRLRRRRQASPPTSTAKWSSRDQVKMRDLPPALQEMMLPMQVGQATRPFGSIEEGVRVLVMCGRDEVDPDRAELRPGLCPAQRGARQPALAPLSARPAP